MISAGVVVVKFCSRLSVGTVRSLSALEGVMI